jgi:hypothetical protein
MVMDRPKRESIIRLRTDLSPEECWARIDTIAAMYRFFFPWRFLVGSKPLVAWRRGENLVLAAKWPCKHPYPYWFYGRIVADGKGAVIEGKFRWPRAGQVTIVVAGAVWTLALVGAAFFVLRSAAGPMGKPKTLGMLAFMLLFPIALLWYNVWYARRMDNTVLLMLVAILEATEG